MKFINYKIAISFALLIFASINKIFAPTDSLSQFKQVMTLMDSEYNKMAPKNSNIFDRLITTKNWNDAFYKFENFVKTNASKNNNILSFLKDVRDFNNTLTSNIKTAYNIIAKGGVDKTAKKQLTDTFTQLRNKGLSLSTQITNFEISKPVYGEEKNALSALENILDQKLNNLSHKAKIDLGFKLVS